MIRKYGWIALLTLLTDQAIKWIACACKTSLTLIPGVLAFTFAENTGMAFSLFSGQSWLLGIFSGLVILAGWRFLRRYRLGPLPAIAAMLMLGGALGNMLDRLLRGYVVDMFEVLLFRFAIFNVADAALTTGCALMALSLLLRPDDWSIQHEHDQHE